MTAHTPGPWFYDTYPDKGRGFIVDSGGYTVAEISKVLPSNIEPDARLMAAAPDLLDALRACVDYMACIPETAAGGDDEAIRLMRLASAVLEKATGAA